MLSHCIPGITLLDTSKESGILGGGGVPLNVLSSQEAFSACFPYAAVTRLWLSDNHEFDPPYQHNFHAQQTVLTDQILYSITKSWCNSLNLLAWKQNLVIINLDVLDICLALGDTV